MTQQMLKTDDIDIYNSTGGSSNYEFFIGLIPGVKVEYVVYSNQYSGQFLAKIKKEGVSEPLYIIDDFGSCPVCDGLFDFLEECYYGRRTEYPMEDVIQFMSSYIDEPYSEDDVIRLLKITGSDDSVNLWDKECLLSELAETDTELVTRILGE